MKCTFLDSSHQYLSNNIQFVWFRGGPYFSIVFGNDVVLTKCLHNVNNLFLKSTCRFQVDTPINAKVTGVQSSENLRSLRLRQPC